MKNLFKAIELINKSHIDRNLKEGMIRDIRECIRDEQRPNYFLEPEKLDDCVSSYTRCYRGEYKYPYYRYGKHHTVLQLNGGYYIKSIKKALETGDGSYLKSKEFYYEIDDKYYFKDEHFLFEGKCYKKDDYVVIDNKVIDRATINELRCYDYNSRREYIEPYVFEKVPIRNGEFARRYENETEAFITIHLGSCNYNMALANSFQYEGTPFSYSSGFLIYGRHFYGNHILIPIQIIDKVKFEVPTELYKAMLKLESRKVGFKTQDIYNSKVKFNIIVKRWTKKYRMINEVFKRADFIPVTKANKTFKMIKDIMEVK